MKKTILILFAFALILPVPTRAQSFVFSVKSSGLDGMQGAQFALTGGSLRPFVGIDYLGFKTEVDISDVTTEMGVSMFIPYIGARYYLNLANATRPYLFGGFFKSFPSIRMKVDGEDILPEASEDILTDILGFWGIKLGFGAEYAVSEWFSVGGELGLNLFKTGTTLDEADFGITTDIKAALNSTYAAFVLNFFL